MSTLEADLPQGIQPEQGNHIEQKAVPEEILAQALLNAPLPLRELFWSWAGKKQAGSGHSAHQSPLQHVHAALGEDSAM